MADRKCHLPGTHTLRCGAPGCRGASKPAVRATSEAMPAFGCPPRAARRTTRPHPARDPLPQGDRCGRIARVCDARRSGASLRVCAAHQDPQSQRLRRASTSLRAPRRRHARPILHTHSEDTTLVVMERVASGARGWRVRRRLGAAAAGCSHKHPLARDARTRTPPRSVPARAFPAPQGDLRPCVAGIAPRVAHGGQGGAQEPPTGCIPRRSTRRAAPLPPRAARQGGWRAACAPPLPSHRRLRGCGAHLGRVGARRGAGQRARPYHLKCWVLVAHCILQPSISTVYVDPGCRKCGAMGMSSWQEEKVRSRVLRKRPLAALSDPARARV